MNPEQIIHHRWEVDDVYEPQENAKAKNHATNSKLKPARQ